VLELELVLKKIWKGLDSYTYMGLLRLVGSLKLQVSFAEYSLFHRAPLQKRPVNLRSLLIVATPYVYAYIQTCIYGWGSWIYIHLYMYTNTYVYIFIP